MWQRRSLSRHAPGAGGDGMARWRVAPGIEVASSRHVKLGALADRTLAAARRVIGRVRRLPRRSGRIILGAIVLLLAARIAAPLVIEWKINRELARHPTYDGYITDVDLFLLIGEVEFEGLNLERRRAAEQLPLLTVASIEVDYRWTDLIHGALVADVHVYRPRLNLVPGATRERKAEQQVEARDEGSALELTAEELFPARINQLTVSEGRVRFRDGEADPKVDIVLSRIRAVAHDLDNQPSPEHGLPASARGHAVLQDSGDVQARLRLNLFAEHPTFDLEVEMRGLALTSLRDLTRAYADVDMEGGVAHLFAEAAAADGSIEGYVKPMVQRADVLEWSGGDEEDDVTQKLWEGAVGGVKEILEDDEDDRVASKVPFAGKLDDPGADTWAAVVELLVNAFIEPLLADVDASIDFGDVLSRGG